MRLYACSLWSRIGRVRRDPHGSIGCAVCCSTMGRASRAVCGRRTRADHMQGHKALWLVPTDLPRELDRTPSRAGRSLAALSVGLLVAAPALRLNVLAPYHSFEWRRFLFAIVVVGAAAVVVTGLVWLGSRQLNQRTLSLSAVILLCLFQWPLFTRAGELAASLVGEFLGQAVVPVAFCGTPSCSLPSAWPGRPGSRWLCWWQHSP